MLIKVQLLAIYLAQSMHAGARPPLLVFSNFTDRLWLEHGCDQVSFIYSSLFLSKMRPAISSCQVNIAVIGLFIKMMLKRVKRVKRFSLALQ